MLEKALGLEHWSSILKATKPAEDGGNDTRDLVMPDLPFKEGDLDPIISRSTIDAHLQIHKRYVDKTRELVRNTPYAEMTLGDVVRKSAAQKEDSKLFRNAAQAWNHAFYWLSISPPGKDTAPQSALLEAVNDKFGSIEECHDQIIHEAAKMFGSGYVWLVQEEDKPNIVLSKDAMTPLAEGLKPILCLDLWEHAYFLDYESDRKSYIDSAVKQLLNWGFADKNWEDHDEW